MTRKQKPGPASPASKRVSKTKPTSKAAGAKMKKAPAKAKAAPAKLKVAEVKPAKIKAVASAAAKRAEKIEKPKAKVKARTKAAGVKTAGAKMAGTKSKLKIEPGYTTGERILDPIGDTSDGEGRTYLGDSESQAHAEMAAFKAETALDAQDATFEAGPGLAAVRETMEKHERGDAEEAATARGERPAGKLERLQKILSQAGIASRRHAEEMITEGRVIVNGQVVTTLGSKADITRDHIRVDGKLLKGVERHRYFVLNKPKGYVTTVSDPEGRPTVMEFFTKMGERLYPVGRLDYLSEGLLLMTNDGELANLLTKAGSGVEKTYLVKVAGQPTEEELERLRAGVEIERGEEGSARVRTSPARVRQVREGDNPWYEVVLIEGRNRELRKMFVAVGHFVEKIRRVGYGPLVLDVEPGQLRELTAEEVAALRLTAEGKMKPRRVKTPAMLPKDAGRPAEARSGKAGARGGRPEFQGRPPFRAGGQFGRGGKPAGQEKRPDWKREPRGQRDDRPGKTRWQPREQKFGSSERRPEFSSGGALREFPGGDKPGDRRGFQRGGKPSFGKPGEGRPGGRPGFGGPRTERPGGGRNFSDAKPRFERPKFDRPNSGLSFTEVPPGSERPGGERPGGRGDFSGARPRFDRPSGGRNSSDSKPGFKSRPRFDRPGPAGGPLRERTESGAGERPRRPFGAPSSRPPFKKFGESKGRFERAPGGGSGGTRGGKPWTGRPRTAPAGEGGRSDGAPGTRFEPRGGFRRPGGFSKPGGKGGPYRGKPGGGSRGGSYRPGGRPSGGKRG